MRQIVIMPGGFHPFHAGHASLYQSAIKVFPSAEVYVAATNDTKTRPFPFSIKEKLAKVAGVAPGHFVQVKSPFKSEEITSHYNPNEDVLIFVRSEKDKTEQPKPGGTKKDGSPAYFQPWTGKNLQPFSKHAYIAYLPTVEFGPGITSASEIRNAWPTLNDRRKTAMVMSLYPATQKNPKLAANVVKMLDMGMGTELAEGSLNEFVPPSSDRGDGGDSRSRRIRKLLEIAIQVAKEKNVDELGMIHGMNMIAGDEFFNTTVEGILSDITDKEYMFVLQSAYKTVKQGLAEGSLNELSPGGADRGGGNYFKTLASAWYNGTFNTGSLQKGIKGKEDVERLLQRGIVCPDGKTRKFGIDYNAKYNGVVISSDDYYEHSDHGKQPGTMIDTRTGQAWGPYDYMEFTDDELDESIDQGMAEAKKKRKKKSKNRSLGRYFFPGYSYYGGGGESGEGGDGGGGESINHNMTEGPFVQRIMHPKKVSIYLRLGKGSKLVATDIPYEILDSYVKKVIQKYPQFKPTDFSFKSSDKVDENLGIPYPTTYEQENNKFKRRGPMRITAMTEFATPGSDDREPDEEEILRQLAAQWWNGSMQQMKKAQQTLQAMGWDIGQDESGDDDAGVFVIRIGDENGDSYIAFNHSDLGLNEDYLNEK